MFYLDFTPKLVTSLTLYKYYLTQCINSYLLFFFQLFIPTHSYLLVSVSFFPNTSFRRYCRRFLVINSLIARISPCFSCNNYLNLPHVPYFLIYLSGDTYMFILNSWSFWSINCLPLVQSSTTQGQAWQRLRRRSVQGTILKCVVITVTGVFCSAVATGWAVSIRDIVRETRGGHVIFSPACPHPRPLHSPASGSYPPLTPPGPCHLLLTYPQGVLTVLIIWKQSISPWICGLFKAQFGGGVQHLALFCHLVKYQVCWVCVFGFFPGYLLTRLPHSVMNSLRTEAMSDKSLNSHIWHRLWHIVRRQGSKVLWRAPCLPLTNSRTSGS